MININKILVATDFSENAIPAYIHAEEIAHRFEATVDFIHIIPTLKYFSESLSSLDAPLDTDEDIYPTIQKETTHKLKELMSDYIKDEYIGETITKIDRKPSTAISEVSKKGGYDLVVMASKGGHESSLMRGSTTEKVIRHAEVPVFTVDSGLKSEGLKRILLPTDGSITSLAALPMALTIAHTYEAEITLFHVMEHRGALLDDEGWNDQKSDEINTYESIIRNIEKFLVKDEQSDIEIIRGEVDYEDQFVITDGVSSYTINFYTVIEEGNSASKNIQEHAKEYADVVVMATHGHGGMAHFFLGSTTEKIVRHVDLPVVVMKPDKKKLQQ